MRFTFLSAFPPYRGGIAQFSAALVGELRKAHEVDAFTFTRQYPGLFFPGSTQYVANGATDDVHAIRTLDSINPMSWGRTAKAMLATEPDVAVLRYWMPFFAPAMGTVARKLRRHGVKVISIVDNALPHEPHFYDKPLTRWFLRQNNGLIAMAGTVEEDILALHPQAEVGRLFHPLYDHFGTPLPQAEARKQLGLPAGAKVLLFFGLIRSYKGLAPLLEAFDKLPDDHHLVVAGEPYGSFAPYQAQIGASPAKGRIHLHTRFIPDAEVPVFFSAADAVVLPYRSATQSGITAMAFHFGVPVVATDVGGMRDTVQEGRTGVLVEGPGVNELVDGVERLFRMDGAVLRAGIAELRAALSWERFAQGLVSFAESR